MNLQPSTLPICVAIPVKNEEANLPSCLAALGRFADIVVIDSGSTDRTCEIALEYGARVVQFAWNGEYPKKRNWFLINVQIEQDWILFLDADEIVNDTFCNEITTIINDESVSGFWLNYTNYFLGKQLKYGVSQKKLALFRVGSGLYERIDEHRWSALDMEVHEHPVIQGKIEEIITPIEHRDYKGLSAFVDRHRHYAGWEAKRFIDLNAKPTLPLSLTKRQLFKYRHLHQWWYPWFYFLYTYVVKLGFLDGGEGFHYATFKAWYFQTIRLLILEQNDEGK